MCGIAGIFSSEPDPYQQTELNALLDAIVHRGPDGVGMYTDGSITLGHRRLAILDLSDAGKQPSSFGTRYWITYNGEVYNFVELRRELESLGHRFETLSDTEVVVAAYAQWGAECVGKFNGMWAFAIWDTLRKELFLSRDRFGVKPLHYLSQPKRFVFASELKCFLRLRDFRVRRNERELRRQLAGRESLEETLIEGVQLLRPGHNAIVSASGMRTWRWWRTLDHLVKTPKKLADQAAEFRELLFDACRVRLRSDVPVATCLSGGLDSSSILCSVAAMSSSGTCRMARDSRRAFVATFEGTPHDELAYAKAAIAKSGLDARYRPMQPVVEELAQYVYDFESVGHALLLPVWSLYRELRRDGVIVSLDGLGADELLMGYGSALRQVLIDTGSMIRHPFRTLDVARTVQRQYQSTESLPMMLAQTNPFLRLAGRTVRHARRMLGSGTAGSATSSPGFAPRLDPEEPEPGAWADLQALTPMNRVLYDQFHYGVNQSLLRKYDRLSMANSIEARLPFMDWRLVCYAFSLPDESKVGGGYSKRILREAMRGVLPEQIRTRTTKIGFLAPLANWMNADLGEWASARVRRKSFLESDIWNGPAIRDFFVPRHANKAWNEGDSRQIWRYLHADLLCEQFFS